ncbi:D-Ala-D-Ala carboxypeptidase family metallohydrolase [Sphingobium sp. BYY-5]|uniref:D-Ala-D-Ala carboxypeptidase family metallohydrolase n=1 Tax=Sphingobium sp. BYY-5 TaxID=2926400 RepID=UPI001FA6AA61|nr:D-Ala-D-Ala carboxypeptidase family metallohydrolase [Sphingobium sp. BYY-5]MCI4588620.1 D-Ala-D-Ala carboxypeptidase family metallohydrolase [Sphingobium sp. BYY-5]
MQLSPHFTLAEFTASATAKAQRIDNTPNAEQIAAMTLLCTKVLEPLRAHFGRPIRITSGFRAPKLCLAVGSSVSSQHAKGEAADLEIPGIDNLTVASFIRDRLPFDQLILENYVRGQPNSGWIHASYRGGRLRQEVLTYSRRAYFKGLLA